MKNLVQEGRALQDAFKNAVGDTKLNEASISDRAIKQMIDSHYENFQNKAGATGSSTKGKPFVATFRLDPKSVSNAKKKDYARESLEAMFQDFASAWAKEHSSYGFNPKSVKVELDLDRKQAIMNFGKAR